MNVEQFSVIPEKEHHTQFSPSGLCNQHQQMWMVAGIQVWFLIHLIANKFGSLSLERRLLINVQYYYGAAAFL